MHVDPTSLCYRLKPAETFTHQVETRSSKKRKSSLTEIDMGLYLQYCKYKIIKDVLVLNACVGGIDQYYAISLKEKTIIPTTKEMYFKDGMPSGREVLEIFKKTHPLARWEGKKSIPKTAFAQNLDSYFIGFRNGTIKGISKESFEQTSSFKTDEKWTPRNICLHNDLMIVGYQLGEFSYQKGFELRLIIWDIHAGKQIRTLIEQMRGTVMFIHVHKDQIICRIEEEFVEDAERPDWIAKSDWIGGKDIVRNDKILLFDLEC